MVKNKRKEKKNKSIFMTMAEAKLQEDLFHKLDLLLFGKFSQNGYEYNDDGSIKSINYNK